MSRKLFGTDGIRGLANREPMTPATLTRVAMAAGLFFRRDHGRRPLAVIAKDTRLSGYMVEPALVSGFSAIGMDVVVVGPMPTPAVAMLVPSLRADLGVMISASHNPFHDNGVKLFGPDGYKLSDASEAEIERILERLDDADLAAPRELGRARRLEDVRGRYVEAIKASFPKELSLEGLKIVIDCANGAAYKVAPQVLYELGAEVIPIGVTPDGFNINEGCGATSPQAMQNRVIAEGADLGVALDGDADRLILADEAGQKIDGDQVLGLIARSWSASGRLTGGGVVATVMSNLGLERYLRSLDLELVRTNVGDRYVLEHMHNHGFNVGGEQSGHMILSDYATTGDGLLAALQVLSVMVQKQQKLSEVSHVFDPVPQILKNVRFAGQSPLEHPKVKDSIKDVEARLTGKGRLLIRKSGTEPLLRVMAEGDDAQLINEAVDEVISVAEAATREAAL